MTLYQRNFIQLHVHLQQPHPDHLVSDGALSGYPDVVVAPRDGLVPHQRKPKDVVLLGRQGERRYNIVDTVDLSIAKELLERRMSGAKTEAG